MNKKQPTMAELLVGRSSSNRQDEGFEKAAAQHQVGEVFEGLTKEAKDELIGTLAWGGNVFGEGVAKALGPVLEKIAAVVVELKELSKEAKTNLKNMEMPEMYEGGSSSGKNPGGLPAKLKDPHEKGNEKNVEAVATPTNNKQHPGATGWSEIQGDKQRKLQATRVDEQGKTAAEITSSVLETLRGGGQTKEASQASQPSLADLGRGFADALKQDLAKANGQ